MTCHQSPQRKYILNFDMVLLQVENLWTMEHTFFYLHMVRQIIDQCTHSGKELSQNQTIAYHLHAMTI